MPVQSFQRWFGLTDRSKRWISAQLALIFSNILSVTIKWQISNIMRDISVNVKLSKKLPPARKIVVMSSKILEPEQEMRLQRCSVWWEWTVIFILTLHRSTELEIEQETGNTETQKLCVSARLSLNVWQKRENPAFARSLTSAALKAGTKNPAMRPISSSIKSWESGPVCPFQFKVNNPDSGK